MKKPSIRGIRSGRHLDGIQLLLGLGLLLLGFFVSFGFSAIGSVISSGYG